MKPIRWDKPRRELTRKQLKRLAKGGHRDAFDELVRRIGWDRAVTVWNSTAYSYYRPE